MRGATLSRLIGAVILVCLAFRPAVAAIEACEPVVGELVSVEGAVQLQRAAGGSWQAAGVGTKLCDKDTVRTEANSRAAISLVNDAVFRIDQNTAVHLADIAPEPEGKSFVELLIGAIQSFSRKPREIAIDTPYLNATVEGTEFVIRVTGNETQVTVFEGTVRAVNDQGEAAATSGQMIVAQAGQAPQPRVVVRPRDAAQWSIFYPPVLAAAGGGRPPADLPPAMAEAAALAGQGNAAGALDAMERVPVTSRDARWHLYRAAFLLAAGQVGEAGAAIDEALRQDSGSGLAYAQRAVIDVARNRNEDALQNAERAVELAPDSTAARIAHSYALQAAYRLDEARQTLVRALTANPDDALARARLAELWMMVGYRSHARAEAEKAVELAPNLQRAQMVLGFAALVEIRTKQARAAFEKAIALDSDDPMAHLGLGLALIRGGELAEGRKQIEVAVGLDSENALLRAYLGKAYFEERRGPLDGEQLAMAKQFDPNDPTAYLYDAIRKQSENRPGEALHDLQKSIELNDNRAVYRGRLQLDEDRAARGASLARVYSDLGFYQQGLREATKSLADDPTSASAHRFLSDSYAGVRRREISRVSEQLQAQMLQDININPVSPSGSVANLNTGGGPSAGFNEYTALFERNQVQFNLTQSGGTQDTFGGEGVVSAIHDWLSISAGVYRYTTDGWRENHGIEHDIQNVYVQAAITPELNLQLEYRHRDSVSGDLDQNFDPDDFLAVKESTLDQDIARAGLRWSPTPNSDVLFSYIYSDREDVEARTDPGAFFGFDLLSSFGADDEGYQAEAQYLYRSERFNVTAGLAYTDVDRVSDVFIAFDLFGTIIPLLSQQEPSEIKHSRGYVYANVKLPEPVTWTLGVSYDDYELEPLEVQKWNPKFGVQWDITENLRLRGAYFSTVKPALVANRTIEPTQVAGFNQFFDNANATESTRYGGGLDWGVTDTLTAGAEATWRDIVSPIIVGSAPVFEDRDEQLHRVYLYWTPIPSLALSGEAVYDLYRSEAGVDVNLPSEVKTISVPLTARYFHPSGFFAGVRGTYVDQTVERLPAATRADGTSSFVTVDAMIGYRLANRHGMVSLSVQNLLDEEFNYQDDGFREFSDEPSIGPYIPARAILGQLTLRF
ncbi:MAG: TonB-dependent receptor [Alphaproteobacteria bacterium]